MPNRSILIVEDDSSSRSALQASLELEGYQVVAARSSREALAHLEDSPCPIVISDIQLDERSGLDILHAARQRSGNTAVILMTARGTVETVRAATAGGAFDYLAKPLELDRLLASIRRAEAQLFGDLESRARIDHLPPSSIIGSSSAMVQIYKTICRAAPTDASVLLEGETGSGKEVVAQLIHKLSRRAAMPFIAVNCCAISPDLLDSELFGAIKGAYTGADRDRIGVLEAAHRGTIFLDEIGDMDPRFQLRLLRFLQEHEIRPVGASRSRPVDVRVIAATNCDLREMVDKGKFRQDLWFRLNVVRLLLPPLRERRSDIPALAQHFLDQYNQKYGLQCTLTESGLRALEDYTWPGNVRQLQHTIERLTVLTTSGRLHAAAVNAALHATDSRDSADDALASVEAQQIRRVFSQVGGNKTQAARILGIERKTLNRKLTGMGLN